MSRRVASLVVLTGFLGPSARLLVAEARRKAIKITGVPADAIHSEEAFRLCRNSLAQEVSMKRWHAGLSTCVLVVLTALPIGCSRSTAREATEKPKPAAPAAAAQGRATTAATGVDACSLLTIEEVGAAIGKPVTAVTVTTGQAASCAYHDATHQPNKFVELLVYTVTPSEAKAVFEGLKGGGRDQVAVPGIGDDAYWDTMTGLSVLKGRYKIGISVTDYPVDGLKVARRLAPMLLNRLP